MSNRESRSADKVRTKTENATDVRSAEYGDERPDEEVAENTEGSFANVLDVAVDPSKAQEMTVNLPRRVASVLSSQDILTPSVETELATRPPSALTAMAARDAVQVEVSTESASTGPLGQDTDLLPQLSFPTRENAGQSLERTAMSPDGVVVEPTLRADENAVESVIEPVGAVTTAVEKRDGNYQPSFVGRPDAKSDVGMSPAKVASAETANQGRSDSEQQSRSNGEPSDLGREGIVRGSSIRTSTNDNVVAEAIPTLERAPFLRSGQSISSEHTVTLDLANDPTPQLVSLPPIEQRQVSANFRQVQMPEAVTQLATVVSGRFEAAGRLPARLEVELDPPELGRLNVELVDTRQGITAKITASRESTAILIDHQLAGLKQSLQDSGIEVHEFHVSYDSAHGESGDERGEHRSSRTDERDLAQNARLLRRRHRSIGAEVTMNSNRPSAIDPSRVDMHV